MADRRGRIMAAAFWLGLLSLCMIGLSRDLWTPDEPREAEMAREMVLAPGVIPTLAGHPFYEKPPLYYWTVASAYLLTGGASAWGARLVSGIAGFLTLLVVFVWGKRAHSKELGIAAAVLLALSSQFTVSIHWIIMDPLLMLLISLASWAGYELACKKGGKAFLFLFYGAMAMAMWTKGFIGPLCLALGLCLHWLLERRSRPWKPFHPFLGSLFMALCFLSVGAAFYAAGGKEALYQWGWVNHVERFLNPQTTGHTQPFWYYAVAIIAACLPWLVPLASLFSPGFWKLGENKGLKLYCISLVAGGFLLLSASATKRETYLLPILPPLFILLGLCLIGLQRKASAGSLLAKGVLRGQVILAGAWGVALPAAEIFYFKRVSLLGAGLAAASVLSAILAWIGLARGRFSLDRNPAQMAPAVSAVLAMFLIAVPALAPKKDMSLFISEIGSRIPAGAQVAVLGADETLCGIIPFVTGRGVAVISETPHGSSEGPFWLVWQGQDEATRAGLESSGYVLVTKRTFGSARTVSLWRRVAGGARGEERN
jgi:4-amino-4-deoxy-L-arabinose transferase-like glycosyltransferase